MADQQSRCIAGLDEKEKQEERTQSLAVTKRRGASVPAIIICGVICALLLIGGVTYWSTRSHAPAEGVKTHTKYYDPATESSEAEKTTQSEDPAASQTQASEDQKNQDQKAQDQKAQDQKVQDQKEQTSKLGKKEDLEDQDKTKSSQATIPGEPEEFVDELSGVVEKYKEEKVSDKELDARLDHLLKSMQLQGDEESQVAMKKLIKVLSILQDDYYKQLSDADLIRAMTEGVVNTMDSPFTFYVNAKDHEADTEAMSGEYEGIGVLIQFDQEKKTYTVTDIMDGSPAGKIGLRIGDAIVKVGDTDTRDFEDIQELVSLVRGKPNTTVHLTVYRPDDRKEYEFDVPRKKIQNANIRVEMLEDGIGYIRMTEFSQGLAKNFKQGVTELLGKGAKTFIFDMRNNGGGFVNEVLDMLNFLLPETTIASAKGRTDGKNFETVWESDAHMGVPESMHYFILTNEFTASASELFTGSLRENGKAESIGVTTFGKGVGTLTLELEDKSAVQVTNFHYYLPHDVEVHEVGLPPNYEVELPKEMRGLSVSQLDRSKDPQFQKALELARKELKK